MSTSLPEFPISLISKDKVEFTGSVVSVSCRNEMGNFDVLSGHANFVAPIIDGAVVKLADGSQKEFTFKQGYIHVVPEETKIFIGE